MSVPLPAWLGRAADGIRALAQRPVALFVLLLAINLIGRPCSVTSHDARLYSLQALNAAEDGAYSEDIFLRYGSQDQYSLYSRIVGPVVAVLGLRLAFFLLYLFFNALFVLALFRLARALVDDAVISTLALVYLVTAPLPYGGHGIFFVHEQFFTPRIIGTTCTLFALERMLRQRFVIAAALLLAGGLMHPLMAFGGVLVWMGYVGCTILPARAFLASLAVVGVVAAIVLGVPGLGTRVFGELDDEWHRLNRLAVEYNYPDAWHWTDWMHNVLPLTMTILGGFVLFRDGPERRRFLLAAALAGTAGLIGTILASFLPYALLLQGQPYRALWILKVLEAPIGFLLIVRWSAAGTLITRIASLGLIGYFCLAHGLGLELMIFGFVVTISVLVARLGADTAAPGWWWYACARGLVLGALAWMLNRLWIFTARFDVIVQHIDPNELAMVELISPMLWLVAISIFAGRAAASGVAWRVAPLAPAGLAAVITFALFACEASPTYRREHSRIGGDMAFVQEFVQQRERNAARRPSIYCSLGRPELLWIDVGATSYYDILQTAGVIFHRKTAVEADRRCLLVAPFEMYRLRQLSVFHDEGRKASFARYFRMPFDGPDPTEADLLRLCHEPDLDLVVVPHEFPGLYSASNGRVYVYECRKVVRADAACASHKN